VATGRIDLEALSRDRDQISAEAKVRYDKGAEWWLTGNMLAEASEEQAQRYAEDDAWHEPVSDYILGRNDVSVGEILKRVLYIDTSRWTQRDQNRVAKILRREKWKRYRASGTGRPWRYRKSA
jgi:predicted P-loop ATPase